MNTITSFEILRLRNNVPVITIKLFTFDPSEFSSTFCSANMNIDEYVKMLPLDVAPIQIIEFVRDTLYLLKTCNAFTSDNLFVTFEKVKHEVDNFVEKYYTVVKVNNTK